MRCRPRLFTLVNPENDQDVFAVGIDMGDEAITYRPRDQFGVHESAKAALRLYSVITEVRLEWDDGWDDQLTSSLPPGAGDCAASDSGL
ncbi:hypothetical protein [Amycolatopsis palatopharyngis]|uniref:hypothetical protein n=1 Tax=Amycolatopsis palatopharyngis TaxID=187982 RepID=UPI000E27E407|nr:hypothetical protein [Amycolatopsis palatopharyngis]